MTGPDSDGIYTDGIFTYAKEGDEFVRVCKIKWLTDFPYDKGYVWPPEKSFKINVLYEYTNTKFEAILDKSGTIRSG